LFFLLRFCFWFGTANCRTTIRYARFERLMCEVEFWEVFLKGAKRLFLRGLLSIPRVGCRIAKLELVNSCLLIGY